MTEHTALGTSVVLGFAVAIGVAVTTPWRPFAGAVSHADPARDLTGAEVARARRYSRAANVPRFASAVVRLGCVLVLGFTTAGAHLASSTGVSFPFPFPWPLRVVLGTVAVLGVSTVAALPLAAWRETIRRRYGLSVQRWAAWSVDRVRDFAVDSAVVCVGLLALIGTARAAPRHWWAITAAIAATLVLVLSFGAPLVVEPLFNTFTPLPPGGQRDELLAMAVQDGVRVADVLVADASRRTTALNAYVSGFGATRRIVVYDTLLARPADEVRLVVSHELGHAVRRDVVSGTMVAAGASAAAVALLGFVLSSNEVVARSGVDGPGDPRAVALLLALGAVLTLALGPPASLVSRRIEARADVHSLDSTRDAAVFIRAMRELAVTNVANPCPNRILHALSADHPSVPERIALARAWATTHGVAVPPDLARARDA